MDQPQDLCSCCNPRGPLLIACARLYRPTALGAGRPRDAMTASLSRQQNAAQSAHRCRAPVSNRVMQHWIHRNALQGDSGDGCDGRDGRCHRPQPLPRVTATRPGLPGSLWLAPGHGTGARRDNPPDSGGWQCAASCERRRGSGAAGSAGARGASEDVNDKDGLCRTAAVAEVIRTWSMSHRTWDKPTLSAVADGIRHKD